MNAHEVLDRFLERNKKAIGDQVDKSLLLKVFTDLDKVLDFESMPEISVHQLLNYIGGFRDQYLYPTKKSWDQFFDSVDAAGKVLRKLRPDSLAWCPLNNKERKFLATIESRLNRICEDRETRGSGRRKDLTRVETIALLRVYEILEKSRKTTPELWRGFKIKEIGSFTSKNSSFDQMYRATPSKLISNLAKSLQIDWSENKIENVVETERCSKREEN